MKCPQTVDDLKIFNDNFKHIFIQIVDWATLNRDLSPER